MTLHAILPAMCRWPVDSSLEASSGMASVEQYQAMRGEMEELLAAKETEILRLKDALGSREQSLSSAAARIRSLQGKSQVSLQSLPLVASDASPTQTATDSMKTGLL